MDNLIFMGVKMGKNGGIFRSDDEGDSWTRISTKEMGSSTYALAVSESTLYACAGGNVFRSDDKGDSWIHVSKGMPDRASAALVAISADTVFVSTKHQKPRRIIKSDFSASTVFVPTFEGSIFRTTDAGNSWVEANTGIMHSSVVDLEVLGNRIYAFTGNRLFFSVNGGETWERIENSQKPFIFRFSGISALNGKLYVGATRFGDKSRGGAVGGVFQLDEQSNTLIEVKTDREIYAIECMHIVGTTFYVGTQGQGVFLWNEGWDSWLNLGLEEKEINEISVDKTNVYAKTQQDEIYRLENHQAPWELIKEDTEAHRWFAQSRKIEDRRFVLSKKVGLMRSEDGGNTWTQLNAGLEKVLSNLHELINPHELIATVEIDDTGFYIGTSQNEIFKWNHKDERWEQLGSLSRPVQSLAVLNGVLYAGTGAGVFRIQIEK
ncbi:MAG: hypothetical protein OXI43_10775 [Candidatus Poribacteria bacterium]|nr:hypothetical protein [Candidatus Poribacteria bacterium]